MSSKFQELLDQSFPPTTDTNVIRGVREGVRLADSTLESEGYLRSLVGQDLRGHLRRAGILYRLHQLTQAGDLPFSSTMLQMPRGNWHWVEFQSNGCTAHVCRTDGPNLFPQDSPTRQDDRLSNQGDLFIDTEVIVPIRGYVVWLTFGAGDSGEISHLCWGMPSAREDNWLARTNVIRRAESSLLVPHAEEPAEAVKLRFKEHIEEALSSSDSEKEHSPE